MFRLFLVVAIWTDLVFTGYTWVILQYERVCRPEDTPIPIGSNSFVRPETFMMHCEALKKHASV